jgi:hypothetical protein
MFFFLIRIQERDTFIYQTILCYIHETLIFSLRNNRKYMEGGKYLFSKCQNIRLHRGKNGNNWFVELPTSSQTNLIHTTPIVCGGCVHTNHRVIRRRVKWEMHWTDAEISAEGGGDSNESKWRSESGKLRIAHWACVVACSVLHTPHQNVK